MLKHFALVLSCTLLCPPVFAHESESENLMHAVEHSWLLLIFLVLLALFGYAVAQDKGSD